MEKKQSMEIAFRIIAFSGEANSHYHLAINHAKDGLCEEFSNEIALGDDCLNDAHKAQTELLVSEANGEEIPFSVTLIHAQDHLMSAIMWKDLANQFNQMYQGGKYGKE